MTIALGIDTGGTYTDAVLVDHEQGVVLGSAKALTTHHELSIGIARAVSGLLERESYDPREMWRSANRWSKRCLAGSRRNW